MSMSATPSPASRRWPGLAACAGALVAVLHGGDASAQAVGPAAARERSAAPAFGPAPADPDQNKTWRYDLAGELRLLATDNAFVTETDREADLITTGLMSATVSADSRRLTMNADVELSYDYYTHNPKLNGVRASGLASTSLEVLQDFLWIDARGGTSLREVSQLAQTPATERALGANQTQVLNYGLASSLRRDISRAITLGANYDLSGVSFLDALSAEADVPAGNTMSHQADAFISSFSEAERLNWRLSASHENTKTQGGLPSADRQSAQLSTQYRLQSRLFLVAVGGYDRISEPTLNETIEEPFANAGLLWLPSQRVRVRLSAGRRFGGLDANGELYYLYSDRIALTGSFGRSIETPQRVLRGALDGLTRDDAGNLVDPVTGLPTDPSLNPFDLINQAFRRDQAQLALSGRTERSFYRLAASAERRDANGAVNDNWSVQGSVGRNLSRRLVGSVTGSFGKLSGVQAPNAPPGAAETVSIATALNYNLGRTVAVTLSHTYLHRDSTLLEYRENVALLSFRKQW